MAGTTIYIVNRHDFGHHTDEIGREHFEGAYSTLARANRKAKRLFHRILKEEDDNHKAEIEEEEDDPNACYQANGRLFQDDTDEGIDNFTVSVEPAILDDSDSEDGGDTSDNDGYDEENEAADEELYDETSRSGAKRSAPSDAARDEDSRKKSRLFGGSSSQPIDLES